MNPGEIADQMILPHCRIRVDSNGQIADTPGVQTLTNDSHTASGLSPPGNGQDTFVASGTSPPRKLAPFWAAGHLYVYAQWPRQSAWPNATRTHLTGHEPAAGLPFCHAHNGPGKTPDMTAWQKLSSCHERITNPVPTLTKP